jgi:hypothetical protein
LWENVHCTQLEFGANTSVKTIDLSRTSLFAVKSNLYRSFSNVNFWHTAASSTQQEHQKCLPVHYGMNSMFVMIATDNFACLQYHQFAVIYAVKDKAGGPNAWFE